ncbi:hypothetical protein TYRP_023659 [Tyrophagus putrescentiae]|nr:hypothetical protein TYRP_023659 [Tyrophagus putrescentiae]
MKENSISNFTNSLLQLLRTLTPSTEKLLIVENVKYLDLGGFFQAFPLMENSIAAFGSLDRVFRSEHGNRKVVKNMNGITEQFLLGQFADQSHWRELSGRHRHYDVLAIGEQASDRWRPHGTPSVTTPSPFGSITLFHQSIGSLWGRPLGSPSTAMALGSTPLIPMAKNFRRRLFKVDEFGSPVCGVSEMVATKYLTSVYDLRFLWS